MGSPTGRGEVGKCHKRGEGASGVCVLGGAGQRAGRTRRPPSPSPAAPCHGGQGGALHTQEINSETPPPCAHPLGVPTGGQWGPGEGDARLLHSLVLSSGLQWSLGINRNAHIKSKGGGGGGGAERGSLAAWGGKGGGERGDVGGISAQSGSPRSPPRFRHGGLQGCSPRALRREGRVLRGPGGRCGGA